MVLCTYKVLKSTCMKLHSEKEVHSFKVMGEKCNIKDCYGFSWHYKRNIHTFYFLLH